MDKKWWHGKEKHDCSSEQSCFFNENILYLNNTFIVNCIYGIRVSQCTHYNSI